MSSGKISALVQTDAASAAKSFLADLHPLEYEHPFDTTALDALQNTTGVDMIVTAYNKYAVEPIVRIQRIGSGIVINDRMFPEIANLVGEICTRLHYAPVPSIYLSQESEINSYTIGVSEPIIVLTAGAIESLSMEELAYLIGHEIGHMKSQHVLYHQVAELFPLIAPYVGAVGKWLSTPLQLALQKWSRMSQFTADRAGLLAAQDIDIPLRVMMKWSGMPRNRYDRLDTGAFAAQAEAFGDFDYNMLSKSVKFFANMTSTHPWTVLRAAELLKWHQGGDYDAVLARSTADRRYIKYGEHKKTCRQCGIELEGQENFCPGCGGKLRPISRTGPA